MFGPALMELPMHAKCSGIKLLQSVQAYISLLRDGIMCQYKRKGDVRAAVQRPTSRDRQVIKARGRGVHPFLHRGLRYWFWSNASNFNDLAEDLKFPEKAFGGRAHCHSQ